MEFYMGIQTLLNKGQSEAPAFEKLADFCLAVPRALWLDKKVTVIRDSQTGQITGCQAEKSDNLTRKFKRMPILQSFAAIVNVIVTLAYVALSLVAIPLLGVGLILKKISIEKDPKSNSYSKIVQNRLNIEKLQEKKKKITDKFPDANNKKIKEIGIKIAGKEEEISKNLKNIRDEYATV